MNQEKLNNNSHTLSVFKVDNRNIHLDLAAEAFNNYHSNLVGKLNLKYANIDSAILFLRSLFPGDFHEIITVPITEAEITCTVASLKCKNSSGYDGISNRIQKLCREYLGRPLTHIYNSLLILGKFPDCLKYFVNPSFKSG